MALPPQPWIHKAVRTLLATAPGLAWYEWRGAASGPTMSIAAHVACAGAAAALAAIATFAFGLPHPNWAIWSALTVIRPTRSEAGRRSMQRLAGMAVGASIGIAAATSLTLHPDVLHAITAVAVVLMVAFEQYVLAVAVRSALAPLAAWSLHDAAIAAGEARMLCILVGVAIGTVATLLFSAPRVLAAVDRAAARLVPALGRPPD